MTNSNRRIGIKMPSALIAAVVAVLVSLGVTSADFTDSQCFTVMQRVFNSACTDSAGNLVKWHEFTLSDRSYVATHVRLNEAVFVSAEVVDASNRPVRWRDGRSARGAAHDGDYERVLDGVLDPGTYYWRLTTRDEWTRPSNRWIYELLGPDQFKVANARAYIGVHRKYEDGRYTGVQVVAVPEWGAGFTTVSMRVERSSSGTGGWSPVCSGFGKLECTDPPGNAPEGATRYYRLAATLRADHLGDEFHYSGKTLDITSVIAELGREPRGLDSPTSYPAPEPLRPGDAPLENPRTECLAMNPDSSGHADLGDWHYHGAFLGCHRHLPDTRGGHGH